MTPTVHIDDLIALSPNVSIMDMSIEELLELVNQLNEKKWFHRMYMQGFKQQHPQQMNRF